jgi:hypothetical protein
LYGGPSLKDIPLAGCTKSLGRAFHRAPCIVIVERPHTLPPRRFLMK